MLDGRAASPSTMLASSRSAPPLPSLPSMLANGNYLTVPFPLLFLVGYWTTGLLSLLQGRFPARCHAMPARARTTGHRCARMARLR